MPNEAKEPTICDVIRPCPGVGALHLLVSVFPWLFQYTQHLKLVGPGHFPVEFY